MVIKIIILILALIAYLIVSIKLNDSRRKKVSGWLYALQVFIGFFVGIYLVILFPGLLTLFR